MCETLKTSVTIAGAIVQVRAVAPGRAAALSALASGANKRHCTQAFQVTERTLTAFLVHTIEDSTVPLENSLAFSTAVRRAGGSVEMHLYPRGGHGFALDGGLGTTSGWFDRLRTGWS